MPQYREIPPSPRLAPAIECFWTIRHFGPATLHRVVPDGCADLLFTRTGGTVSLDAVGPMTSYRDFPVRDGELLAGVRFHPGRWTAALGVPGERVTDAIVPLEDLWGSRAKELLDRFAEASSLEQSAMLFEAAVPLIENPGRVERALAWMAGRHGSVSIDRVADQAGLSARQFRRVCLEQTGLTPKFLARVLRFRHALSRRHHYPGSFAEFALDCGYYDQAHFINEFRQLSGWTPSCYGDGRFFQSPEGG
ncbi:MAG TPA: AraC family transcriptional regulator [Bryobacteraceae bacterium]|jgi:AraC-like DNA-binding protein|nr:AraC family transcriptional regulator [Bryobacteraceae bacterium]